ncbi:hypothetical protein SMSP2_02844 [Limihaloglobus sulfuriphilus]|uniref:Bacterial Pleckstrin homology domain-containing protein n=1 Tax=Limihaloglobus sulfuriphilus TaxID=1851148 RepID=A0A1Q2MIH2_9BACT|nr:DUF6141 family protein [Limihaloglobus sulfuriphilus]AQQ72459.1 hypothetical protein SMSP2_02844 [Limihaloglobus sulfuriphilus]
MKNTDREIIYSEVQRFSWIINLIFIAVIIISFAAAAAALTAAGKSEEEPLEPGMMLFTIIINLVLLALLVTFQMQTRVYKDAVWVRLLPFMPWFKKIPFEDIREYCPRKYRPVFEYGGWGIRYSFRNGKAYNAKGNKGLQITLKNGKKILIGSQDPEKLADAIKKHIN